MKFMTHDTARTQVLEPFLGHVYGYPADKVQIVPHPDLVCTVDHIIVGDDKDEDTILLTRISHPKIILWLQTAWCLFWEDENSFAGREWLRLVAEEVGADLRSALDFLMSSRSWNYENPPLDLPIELPDGSVVTLHSEVSRNLLSSRWRLWSEEIVDGYYRCIRCLEIKPYESGSSDSPECDECWARDQKENA